MKSFKLDNNNDVVINNNQIELVEDLDLIIQTLRNVLNTNLGEWFGNEDEGIDYSVILTKSPNYELIEDTINTAVQYVADMYGIELEIEDLDCNVNSRTRTLYVTFTMIKGEQTAQVDLEL